MFEKKIATPKAELELVVVTYVVVVELTMHADTKGARIQKP